MSSNSLFSTSLYSYIVAHNPPVDRVMADLIAETAELGEISRMQLGVDQAAFLGFMVGLLNARFVVEVGTFTGLSSLAMARALPEDGRILCCDISDELTSMARRYWERAGVSDRIDLILAPAAQTLGQLDQAVDLAFIDADKQGYISYYEALVPMLSPGGVIIADNVFMGARGSSENATAIHDFVDHIIEDSRTETVMISIGDGFTLSRLA